MASPPPPHSKKRQSTAFVFAIGSVLGVATLPASAVPLGSRQTVEISAANPLINDWTQRILSSCDADSPPGTVTVQETGTEEHPSATTYSVLDEPRDCADTGAAEVCTFQDRLGGFYACKDGEAAFPELMCDCEQCPCPAGTGGLGCSLCTDDSACAEGERCYTFASPTSTSIAYTCDYLQGIASTSALFPAGNTAGKSAIQWDAEQGTLTFESTLTMCTQKQPILFEIECSQCNYAEDSDGSTACADASSISPCIMCSSCSGTYPEDSMMGDLGRGLVSSLSTGVVFGCLQTGECSALFPESAFPLGYFCQAGLCTAEPLSEVVTSSAGLDATTIAETSAAPAESVVDRAIFTDPSKRISATEGSCSDGLLPGAVMLMPRGDEFHPIDAEWSFLSEFRSCDNADSGSTCSYNDDASGYYECPTGDNGDRLQCECARCPCADNMKGFFCSECADDSACSGDDQCIQTPQISKNLEKHYTCEFNRPPNDSGVYNILFGSGWAVPQATIVWSPADAEMKFEAYVSMCTKKQPVLLTCTCFGCAQFVDIIDPVTGQPSGPCKDATVDSPCGKCTTCDCNWPDDTAMGDVAKAVIGVVKEEVAVHCEDKPDGSPAQCKAAFKDLPVDLRLTCTSGACGTPEVIVEEEVSIWETWSAPTFLVLAIITFIGLVLIVLGLISARRRTKEVSPIAPPPTCGPNQELTLSWENVHVERAGKVVLDSVSGEVRTKSKGMLVAVVGLSGCGKTTLLDFIAGHVHRGDKGAAGIDGVSLAHMARRKFISYVPQSEVLGHTLTVRENLEFSASLRLTGCKRAERMGRVQWALERLSLKKVADSQVGDEGKRGISGGERRRTSIGMELIVSPAVMVLDEPTTGLDAAAALSLGKLLASLAEEGGRILLASLHQPRPELQRLFHQVISLGPAGSSILSPVPRPSPADAQFALSPSAKKSLVVDDEEAPAAPRSSSRASPGRDGVSSFAPGGHLLEKLPDKLGIEDEETKDASTRDPSSAAIAPLQQETTPFAPLSPGQASDLKAKGDSVESGEICKFATPPQRFSVKLDVQPIGLTYWPWQVLILWNRAVKESTRGNYASCWSAGVGAGFGLFIGLMFMGVGYTVAGIQARLGSIFFVQMFFAFCSLEICALWYYDRPRMEHERTSRFYRPSAYFFAKASAYLFWYCMVVPALFVGISYPIIGYTDNDIAKPLFYYLNVAGTAAASGGICLFILSMTGSLSAGVSCSAVILEVLIMFSGFLRPKEAMPGAIQWFMDISPYSHSFNAMTANDLAGVDTVFDALGLDPVSIAGDIWLYQFDVQPELMDYSSHRLAIICVVIWAMAFMAIWFELYKVFAGMCCRSRRPTAGPPTATPEKVIVSGPSSSNELEAGGDEDDPSKASGALVWSKVSAVTPNSKRQVLTEMSGLAKPGRPLVVLGPSGCGKTTLLSRLAGEEPRKAAAGNSGEVFLDGMALKPWERLCAIGFVRQDDSLPHALTVREAIAFAAALRLPKLSKKERAERVGEVLERLGLDRCANNRLGGARQRGVSGGERRRTAVGTELVAAKKVLILDEPTSGLDRESALTLCKMLASLASEGRVVMACIHQPEPEVLACFADALVLAPQGRVAFFGPCNTMQAHLDVVCGKPGQDAYASPSDRMLDAVAEEEGTGMALVVAYAGSAAEKSIMDQVGVAMRPTADKEASSEAGSSAAKYRQANLKQFSGTTAPFFTQMWHLMIREIRTTLREPGLAPWHFASALVGALLLGSAYYQLPTNLAGVISRVGLFYAVQCIFGFQALNNLMAWREGHIAFVRERAAGYYNTGPFVLAKTLIDGLILRIGPGLLFGLIIYPMCGLHEGRIGIFLIGVCLISLCSSAFCLFVGALTPRSAVTLPIAVLVLLIMLLFGGVAISQAPDWLVRFSFFRASYSLFETNEFRGLSFEFDPKGVSVEFPPIDGETWLDLLRIPIQSSGSHIGVLFLFFVIYVLLTWLVLRQWRK